MLSSKLNTLKLKQILSIKFSGILHEQRLRNVSVLFKRCSRSVLPTVHFVIFARRHSSLGHYNRFSAHLFIGLGTSSGTFENCHNLHRIGNRWELDKLHLCSLSTGSKILNNQILKYYLFCVIFRSVH